MLTGRFKILGTYFSREVYVAVELPFTSTCVDFKYIIAISNLISPHVTFQEKLHWGDANDFETTCSNMFVISHS